MVYSYHNPEFKKAQMQQKEKQKTKKKQKKNSLVYRAQYLVVQC